MADILIQIAAAVGFILFLLALLMFIWPRRSYLRGKGRVGSTGGAGTSLGAYGTHAHGCHDGDGGGGDC